MRYNIKTGRVELSVGELCPPRRGCPRYEPDPMTLTDIIAGGAPRGIFFPVEYGGIGFGITGRADAVFIDAGGVRVCEFFALPEAGASGVLPDDEAACLAYMFCKHNGAERAELEAVIFDPETGATVRNARTKKLTALEAVFYKRLSAKLVEARMLAERSKLILPGAAAVKFPFSSLREGQELMMRECYDALLGGEILFVQAPTGIGKTLSALYPAVKFLGNGRCDKIFYLTAKTSAQAEAYRASGMLFSAGAKLRTVVLSAKESCCLRRGIKPADSRCEDGGCGCFAAPDERMTGALWRLLALQSGYEQKIIVRTAREFRVCPHELSLRLSEYCEVIIADYNYAFDPLIRLRRYFEDPQNASRYVFLVDEAHNLADRTRSMYSAGISTEDFSGLKAKLGEREPALSAALGDAFNCLYRMRSLCRDDMAKDESGAERGFYTGKNLPEGFDDRLRALSVECEKLIRRMGNDPLSGEIASLGKKLVRCLAAAERFDERFLFFCEVGGKEVAAKIYCLDPSALLGRLLERADAAVMFSATLTPLDYFSDILGGGKRARTLALPSPFDISNLFIGVAGSVSTRYEDREKTLRSVLSYIAAALSGKKGNYIVYFPSYRYMDKAASAFSARYPGVKLLVQKSGMTREDRERFLGEFKRDDGVMRAGFCVLGGSFSEGIDLPGSLLIGVVIVGVGMPGLSSERNIMRDYYERSRESGYDYAYTYPGMNSVLQAAGRVIRSDTDRGVVVLIDDRYSEPKYAAMYPEHWKHMQYYDSAASLNASICEFWKRKDK